MMAGIWAKTIKLQQQQNNKATAKRSAEAFFFPLFIQAILPKSNSINSTFTTPIQKTIIDFHENFHKVGKTIFTTLKLTNSKI